MTHHNFAQLRWSGPRPVRGAPERGGSGGEPTALRGVENAAPPRNNAVTEPAFFKLAETAGPDGEVGKGGGANGLGAGVTVPEGAPVRVPVRGAAAGRGEGA